MSERRFFLDRGIGESRAVVTLDGRPERLLIEREGDDPTTELGASLVGRVRRVEPAIGAAFLELGEGREALLPFKPDSRPTEGAALEVEVRAEARRGKLPVVKVLAAAEGEPRLLHPGPGAAARLEALAKGASIVTGAPAREAADEAEAEVLALIHPLPGGGDLAVEPTRALVSIDVDLGARKGLDAKRVARQSNLAAIAAAARILRLKSLGGLVVIDLVGRGHDGQALLGAARAAFAADNPGVAIGPVTKFGTLELSVPRKTAPLHERLLGDDARLSDQTLALRLVRALETEARRNAGSRVVAEAHPAIAALATPLVELLTRDVGARAFVTPAEMPRERFDVRAL